MAPVPIGLGVRSNPTRRGVEGNSLHTNCFFEPLGKEGKAEGAVYAHCGWSLFSTPSGSAGGIDASLEVDGFLYSVCQAKVFKTTSGGVSTQIGTLTPTPTGFVTMAANQRSPNKQIVIVDNGTKTWWKVEADVVTATPDPDLSQPISVCELDGYFVFAHADGQFTASDPDSTAIDPLSFAKAVANADGLVRAFRIGAYLALAGTKTTEFWQDVGDPTFPFTQMQAVSHGCWTAGSMCDVSIKREGEELKPTLAMIATDGYGAYAGVVIVSGFASVTISTPAVDRIIKAETNKGAIRSFFRIEAGHAYYTLTCTTWTWEYNFTTGGWNPRTSAGMGGRWRPNNCVTLADKILLGDSELGKLFQLDETLFTEAGIDITWSIQPPPMSSAPFDFNVNALWLDVIAQTGITPANNPTISVQYSKDGGVTFSTARTVPVGSGTGQPLTKATTRAFGKFGPTGIQWKFSATAAVMAGMVGATADVQVLSKAA